MSVGVNPAIAVSCSGVTKTYGTGATQVQALRGIDLEVRYGELLMLVGPSGCGKTSLISIIAAILDQDEGRCEVFGHDLRQMGQTEKTRFRGRSVGFVFQVFNLLPALTALENVVVPLLLNGISHRHAERRARKALESVGLSECVDRLPLKLSGGQQQRVAIARALVNEPGLIICDEPTSSLDNKTGHEMISILSELAKNPERALIVVTHDTRILTFADRIAHMDDGRIIDIAVGKNTEN